MGSDDLIWGLAVAVVFAGLAYAAWYTHKDNKRIKHAIWRAVVELSDSEQEFWGGLIFQRVRGHGVSSKKVYDQLNALVNHGRLESYVNSEVGNTNAPARVFYCMPISPLWQADSNPSHRAVLDVVIDHTFRRQNVTANTICDETGFRLGKVQRILDRMVAQQWITIVNGKVPAYQLITKSAA